MTIYGITYSSGNMDRSAELCRQSMLKHGCTEAKAFKAADLPLRFIEANHEVLSQPRGAGYWIWKFAIVDKLMNELPDGSVICYSDAGCEFVNSIHSLVNSMDQDILFFTNTFKQVEWTKGDIMDTILPEWRDGRYNNAMQVQASNIIFKVNDNTRAFVKEWGEFCQQPGLIDDSPSKSPNFPTYAETRHDQSILTALQIKYGYKLHWFPSLTAAHIRHYTPSDQYPAIINHHRKRNHEW